MRGLHKSKRVSWASDVNLCQVRLFLSEDAPFQVGLPGQDHLQPKKSGFSHSVGPSAEDTLPPGFDTPHQSNQFSIKLSEIPIIQWRLPPRIVLSPLWQIVAGEESGEVKDQTQREMRVLEAVYPRQSAIPQDPASSVDAEDIHQSDLQIPVVPITPVEDEDTLADATYENSVSSVGTSISPQPLSVPPVNDRSTVETAHALEPDVAAAASAAFTAIMKSNEPGSAIDGDLLIQILSNPKMIEKLVAEYGGSSNPMPQTLDAMPAPVALPNPPATFYAQPNGMSPPTVPNPRYPPASFAPSSSQPTVRVPPPKDLNYYKHLIHQHGGERQQETPPPYVSTTRQSQLAGVGPELSNSNISNTNPKMRDPKGKIMKPCIYFNSSRGCRNGANCAYQHDTSLPQRGSSMAAEVQSSKRMKLDREITGT